LHLFNNMCGEEGAKAAARIIKQSPNLQVLFFCFGIGSHAVLDVYLTPSQWSARFGSVRCRVCV